MLSRMAMGALGVGRSTLVTPRTSFQNQITRGFRGRNTQAKRTFEAKPLEQVATGLKKKIGPMEVGQLAVCGGAAFGIGSLCFYGLGLSGEPGAVERSVAWPEYVRERIRKTYLYFGLSAGVIAQTAVMVYRSPQGQKFFALCERHPIMSTVGLIAGMIGTSSIMMSINVVEQPIMKHAFWIANCGMIGLMMAPVGVFGGAIALRAAMYTGGIVGGLSTVAACAPSEAYLKWAGPLGIGLGGVFVASIGTMFVPVTSTLGLSLYSISLYGGLLVFSGFLLYDTQKIIHKAETYPKEDRSGYYNIQPFDPINNSHRIVMDAVNIFIRIAQVLMLGGGGRKK